MLRFARNDGAARWIASRSLSSGARSRDGARRMGGANGSRECAPDDRLREAIHRPRRHCERSEAIHLATVRKNGLLRCARNDVEFQTRVRSLATRCGPRECAPDGGLREAIHLAAPSLRAQRSNPSRRAKKEWIASLRSQRRGTADATSRPRRAMRDPLAQPILRATETVIASAAKQSIRLRSKTGLLRRSAPRNDGALASIMRSRPRRVCR